MSNILLAPHSDDEALFASYIIMREKPIVVIVTDGTSHLKKFNISLEDRRAESINALKKLGQNYFDFLRIPEEDLTEERLLRELRLPMLALDRIDKIYVPALQGGHPHHDLISHVATKLYGKKCLYYSTYQKNDLEPVGELEIIPTKEEKQIKEEALQCYASQLKINPHHFEAVKNKSEYINFTQYSWNKSA